MKYKNKLATFIVVIMILNLIIPIGGNFSFAGGIADGDYSVLGRDDANPYMVVVNDGGTYLAYKSNNPIWYVSDENMLIVRVDSSIKKYEFSSVENAWKFQTAYSANLNSDNVSNIDNGGKTFASSSITDYDSPDDSGIKNHNIKVYQTVEEPWTETNEMLVEREARELTLDVLGMAEGDTVNAITQDLALATNTSGGRTITWSTSNPNIIESNGTVKRTTVNRAVTLTATVSDGTNSAIRNFVLNVLARDENDLQKATRVIKNLNQNVLNFEGTDSLNSVTQSFTPTTTISEINEGITENFNLEWVVDVDLNPNATNYIDFQGDRLVVNRPTSAEGDQVVDLEVYLNRGTSNEATKYFRLTIKSTGEDINDKKARVLGDIEVDDITMGGVALTETTAEQIVEDLVIPETIEGETILWSSSSNLAQISGNVVSITRPGFTEKNERIYLTATISGVFEKVEIPLQILKEEEDLSSKQIRILNNLEIGDYTKNGSNNPDAIVENFNIPILQEEVVINWSSDKGAIDVSSTPGEAKIFRPNFGKGNEVVTLTAEINGNTRDFEVIVKQEDETQEIIDNIIKSNVGINMFSQEGEDTRLDSRNVFENITVSQFNNSNLSPLPALYINEAFSNEGTLLSIVQDANNILNGYISLYFGDTERKKDFPIKIMPTSTSELTEQEKAQKAYNELANNMAQSFEYSDLGITDGETSIDVQTSLNLPLEIYRKDGEFYYGNNGDYLEIDDFVKIGEILSDINDPEWMASGAILQNGTLNGTGIAILTANFMPTINFSYDSDGDGINDSEINSYDGDADIANNKNRVSFELVITNTNNTVEDDHSDRILKEIDYETYLGIDYLESQNLTKSLNLLNEINHTTGNYNLTWSVEPIDGNVESTDSILNSDGTIERRENDETYYLYIDEITKPDTSIHSAIANPSGANKGVLEITVKGENIAETESEKNIRIANEISFNELGITDESKIVDGLLNGDALSLSNDYTDTDGSFYNDLISWTSNKVEYIDNSGNITYPTHENGPEVVTLTATVGYSNVATRDFEILLNPLAETTLESAKSSFRNYDIENGGAIDINNISSDISLDSTFNWTVETGNINIASNGTITYSNPSALETSTVRATLNGESRTYRLTEVPEPTPLPIIDNSVLTYIADNLMTLDLLGLQNNEPITAIESNLFLEKTMNYRGKIVNLTWNSPSTNINIVDNGDNYEAVITRPSNADEDTVLTATLDGGDSSTMNYDYNVTLLQSLETDTEKVNRLQNYLSIRELGLSNKEPIDGIVSPFTLKNSMPEYPGATINWDISNIPNEWISGNIITPNRTLNNQNFTISATISYNAETSSGKSFDLVVLKEETPPTAERFYINVEALQESIDVRPIRLLNEDADGILDSDVVFSVLFVDANGNPVENTTNIDWNFNETEANSTNGINLSENTQSANFNINRQDIFDYRNSVPENEVKLRELTLNAVDGEGNGLTGDSITLSIEIEEEPPVAQNEIIYADSFDAKTLYLNKYAPFETTGYYEYMTLVNYGERQYMYYTDKKPRLKLNFGQRYLSFDETANIQLLQAKGVEGWEYINEFKSTKSNSKILLEKGINSIEFLNYDLNNSTGDTVLYKNNGSSDLSSPPSLKSLALPSISSIMGSSNYIMARGVSNYWLVSAPSPLTFNSNSVSYPAGTKFYTLVQNEWVENDLNAINSNDLKLTDKTTFKNYLKYTDDFIEGANPNFNKIITGTPNYLDYVLEYRPLNSSKDFMIFKSPIFGVKAIEVSEMPQIVNGRLKFSNGFDFNNSDNFNEYNLVKGSWVEDTDDPANYFNGSYYERTNIASSIIYSTQDVLDNVNNTIFSVADTNKISLYSPPSVESGLNINRSPDLSGYENGYELITYSASKYKAYYSKKPIFSLSGSLVSKEATEVTVYEYNNNSWEFVKTENITLDSQWDGSNIVAGSTYGLIESNILSNALWSNKDIKDALNSDNTVIGGMNKDYVFNDGGEYLSVGSGFTGYDSYNYYLYDKNNDVSSYYLSRFSVPTGKNNNDELISVNNTEQAVGIPQYENWKVILNLEYETNGILGKIRNINAYEKNYDFDTNIKGLDSTDPEVIGAYMYKGSLFIYGSDIVPAVNEDANEDNDEQVSGISSSGYGFKFENDVIFPFDVVGILDGDSSPTTIPAFDKIDGGTKIWKSDYFQELNITEEGIEVTVSVKDNNGNLSTPITLIITKGTENEVLYNKDNRLPIDVINKINYENNVDPIDGTPPIIYAVYMYKDSLYIYGEDIAPGEIPASGLHTYAYGFEFENGGFTFPYDLIGKNVSGGNVNKPSGTEIGEGFELFTVEDNMVIPRDPELDILLNTDFILKLRDMQGNLSIANNGEPFNISEDDNNLVLWENPAYPNALPDYIRQQLEAERNKSEGDANNDTIPPEIIGIYVLDGVLNVIAKDNVGLHNIPYSFDWKSSSIAKEDISGFNSSGNDFFIPKSSTIPKGTKIYMDKNKIDVTIPTLLDVAVRDTSLNVSNETILIDKNNSVVFGKVPESVQNIINDRNNVDGETDEDSEDKNAPTITSVYTFNGKLYVEGFDPEGNLHAFSHGFNPQEDMIIDGIYSGKTKGNINVEIQGGEIVPIYTEIFKPQSENNQEIMIPMSIEVILRDAFGNETRMTVFVKSDNELIYGDMPTDIDGEIEDGTTDDETDSDDNVEIVDPEDETNPGGLIIKPDSIFDNVDWNEYDYAVEIRDELTNRIVYSLQLDKADNIQTPRLEDSTKYKVNQKAINETDDSVLYEKSQSTNSYDNTAPTILDVVYENGYITVNAYDKGGLAEEPFNYNIVGAPYQSESNFVKSNKKRVLPQDKIIVRVKDSYGNIASTTVGLETKDLVKTLNPENPYLLTNEQTKPTNMNYWLEKIKDEFNIDGSLSFVEDNSNINFTDNNRNIEFVGEGKFNVEIEDKLFNKKYIVLFQTLDKGKSNRTIVVQKDSRTNFIMSFKDKLRQEFGTINGISWNIKDANSTRVESFIEADALGLSEIVASRDGKEVRFYVVVSENISDVETMYDFQNDSLPFTFKKGESFDLSQYLSKAVGVEEIDEELQNEYIVLEEVSGNGVSKENKFVNLEEKGVKTLRLINTINDKLYPISFEVVDIQPEFTKFTDIYDSWARAEIEFLAMKGVLRNSPDNKFKPKNNLTRKDFLSMLNRYLLLEDADYYSEKVDKEISLSKKDWDYYSSANVLIGFNEETLKSIFGEEHHLNTSISRKEVAQLLSLTIFRNSFHQSLEAKMRFDDVYEGTAWGDNIDHIYSLGVINGISDNKFGSFNKISREESAKIFSNIYDYFGDGLN